MRHGEVRIDGEGAPERRLGKGEVRIPAVCELGQTVSRAAKPGPRGGELGILRQAGPVEFAGMAGAPDRERGGEFLRPDEQGVDVRLDAGFAFHRQFEAVAVPGHGADRLSPEGFPEADDGVGQAGFRNVGGGPDALQQFGFRYQRALAAHKAHKHVEGLGREADRPPFPLQRPVVRMQCKWAEPVHRRVRLHFI